MSFAIQVLTNGYLVLFHCCLGLQRKVSIGMSFLSVSIEHTHNVSVFYCNCKDSDSAFCRSSGIIVNL